MLGSMRLKLYMRLKNPPIQYSGVPMFLKADKDLYSVNFFFLSYFFDVYIYIYMHAWVHNELMIVHYL